MFLIIKLVQYIFLLCKLLKLLSMIILFANLGIKNFSRKREVNYKKKKNNEKVQFLLT